jgi:Bacterial SH3 domain
MRIAARTHRRPGYWLTLVFVLLAACSSKAPQQAATGVAYVGPANLNLRKDVASKSAPVATVKHGERLDVLETRRRFVKVRTEAGVEGWTDSNLLLSQQQMDDLRRLADSAAKLPPQGAATAYDTLNMHSAPNRLAPGFFQIPESGSVVVIGHRLAPRTSPPAAAPARPAPPPAQKKSKGKESKSAVPPPPPPPAPAPPPEWQSLARPRASDLPGYTPPAPKAPVPLDDWSLVRTKDGKVGWVLSRMLMMSIPDEVAQYAEGHRITAYLPLGEVKDKEKGETKPNWLWTTATAPQIPYEFDSFRVFVWSTKRHRYETAYIERNVKGYYPVETQDLPNSEEKAFSLVLEDKDGKLYKRTYAFTGYRVRMISKAPYQPEDALPDVRVSRSFDPQAAAPPVEKSWRDAIRDLRKRWFGR